MNPCDPILDRYKSQKSPETVPRPTKLVAPGRRPGAGRDERVARIRGFSCVLLLFLGAQWFE